MENMRWIENYVCVLVSSLTNIYLLSVIYEVLRNLVFFLRYSYITSSALFIQMSCMPSVDFGIILHSPFSVDIKLYLFIWVDFQILQLSPTSEQGLWDLVFANDNSISAWPTWCLVYCIVLSLGILSFSGMHECHISFS